jgi:hypothetical protein
MAIPPEQSAEMCYPPNDCSTIPLKKADIWSGASCRRLCLFQGMQASCLDWWHFSFLEILYLSVKLCVCVCVCVCVCACVCDLSLCSLVTVLCIITLYIYVYILQHVIFEVYTVVTMKNAVFWDVMPCRSCLNRHFGGGTLRMEAIRTYETSFQTRSTRRHIPEDGILHIKTCISPFWQSSGNKFVHSPFYFTTISPCTGQCITCGRGEVVYNYCPITIASFLVLLK